LLLIPALVMNGFWWHPDGLGLFFISLTMLFLSLDKWRYSHFFYLAAVSAGIAAGIKYLGLFFVLTIPAYLLWGLITKKINPKTTATKAAFFLILMVVVIIFTNPLLLLPLERSELIATQKTQFSRTSTGELIGMQPFLENGWLPHWFTDNFGTLPFLLALLCALYFGWRKKEHQLEAMLITTYIIPLGIIISLMSLRRTHYLLPIFLPLAASLGFILPDSWDQFKTSLKRRLFSWVAVVLLAYQVASFVITDFSQFQNMHNREDQSASIAFYHDIKQNIFSTLPEEALVVYRDWKVYFPSDTHTTVFMDWDLADYEMLSEQQPDYLLLDNVYITTYGSEDFLESSASPGRLGPMHTFYSDALNNSIDGYQRIYKDQFGSVFAQVNPDEVN
ncbi:MAG: hypothetical protein J7K66_02685, partial [Anaerolineaceae bacterium]|nr:hypothetical protein [Anaerolineaceae bacterium]